LSASIAWIVIFDSGFVEQRLDSLTSRDQREAPMPRHDPVPSPRGSLMQRYLRMMKWLALFSLVIAAIAVLLVTRGEDMRDWNVVVATALGVFFTVLLGSGLMVLTFLSSRSGHDEEAARSQYKEDE
jgi:hypothetical protein